MKTLEVPNEVLISHIAEMLQQGHTVTMNIKGVSMRPFIEPTEDEVLLEPCRNPQKGDIVLAWANGERHVLHRIYEKQGEVLTLMGDGNVRGTETCRCSDVVGRCRAIVHKKTGQQREAEGLAWQWQSRVWKSLLPLRRYLLALYRLRKFGHLHSSKISYEN